MRLLDIGLFRIGSEQYADEEGGVGLATVEKANVTVRDGRGGVRLPGQGRGAPRAGDPGSAGGRGGQPRCAAGGRAPTQLLAYKDGSRWHGVRSEQISDYLKAVIGDEYSAKDFRTWNATVLAAVSVAADGREAASSQRARRRVIDGAVRGVAEVLGNTPAVARRSYIDPRVFDRYLSGWTIGGELDRIGAPRRPRRPPPRAAGEGGARPARRRRAVRPPSSASRPRKPRNHRTIRPAAADRAPAL